MDPYERRATIERLQQEIAEGEADVAKRQARGMAGEADVLETWRAGMPSAPSRQSDHAALLVDALRSEVRLNKRQAQADSETLRAVVLRQRKDLDRLPEAIGEAIGKLLAEHRAEIANLRAELQALRGEVGALRDEVETRQKSEGVVDMGQALALRRGAA